MTAKPRSEALYLADVGDAIDKILSYTAKGRDVFLADTMIQDAVLRNIEVIGEAVRGIRAETRAAHAEVPWKDMAGMRDRVIHDYFRVKSRSSKCWRHLARTGPVSKAHGSQLVRRTQVVTSGSSMSPKPGA